MLSQGRWVLGARWAPPAPTPASPGWVSEESAFAFAADEVLARATGRSFDRTGRAAGRSGLAAGSTPPPTTRAGRKLGAAVGEKAWSLAQRYFSGG